MRVTVAILTRDRSQALKRCLTSLAKQTKKPYEVLIIDTPSLQSSYHIAKSFEKTLKIRYTIEKKIGISYARNRALKEAKGDILAFIDDDCEAFSNWIESIVSSHRKYADAIAIQGWSKSMPRKTSISIVAEYNHLCGYRDHVLMPDKNTPSIYDLLTREAKMVALATKNVSFNVSYIRRKNLKFHPFLLRYEDVEFAKQLIALEKEIVFCPGVRVYHWERPTIREFLKQRFADGQGRMRIRKLWSSYYFPKRRYFWWVSRSLGFVPYCARNGYMGKLPLLVVLFVLEKSVFLLAMGYEWLRLRREIHK